MIEHGTVEIVVVDDSDVQAKCLRCLLEMRNYSVHTFNNGQDALEYLKNRTPHLIITDVIMPNMSGFELCRRIKQMPSTAKVPVIMLTALSGPEDIIQGLASGADNFITKPYSDDFLISRIQYCLVNAEIRKNTIADIGIEIVFGGKKYLVNSNRIQILDLLLATYESEVEKNKELERTVKELKKTQKELVMAKEAAEIASRYKSEFLASMSHEIRTPMNAIIGIADILLDSCFAKEHEESLDMLKNAANSLLDLLNGILDLSKIESGKMELDIVDFDIRKLIKEVKFLFIIGTSKKGLEFTTSVDDTLPTLLSGDPSKIRQMLINLISNALKFTDSGFIRVKVERIEAPPSALEDREKIWVRFSVADSGIGIPYEKQEKIFEAFVQADGSTTKRYGGTGLGLSICKGFVDLMGGIISLESKPNEGSQFHFSLPLGLVTERVSPVDSHQDKEEGKHRALSILVVDDNELNLMIATKMLTKKGHVVQPAKTGLEALEKVKANRYDIVFMDVNMPEMDGLDATRRIRQWEASSGKTPVPVIAMTAYAMKEDRDRCISSGMNDYISKPIDSRAIDLILRKFM